MAAHTFLCPSESDLGGASTGAGFAGDGVAVVLGAVSVCAGPLGPVHAARTTRIAAPIGSLNRPFLDVRMVALDRSTHRCTP